MPERAKREPCLTYRVPAPHVHTCFDFIRSAPGPVGDPLRQELFMPIPDDWARAAYGTNMRRMVRIPCGETQPANSSIRRTMRSGGALIMTRSFTSTLRSCRFRSHFSPLFHPTKALLRQGTAQVERYLDSTLFDYGILFIAPELPAELQVVPGRFGQCNRIAE